jgi:putative hydrolase of the HAD superfamily
VDIVSFSHIPLDGVKGILIDLDDTLYAYEPCHKQALASCCQHFIQQKGSPQVDSANFYDTYNNSRQHVLNRLTPQGCCRSRLLAFQYMFEQWGMSQAYIHALTYDQLYWSSFMKAMKIDPQALEFISSAKALNIKIAVVSDMLMSTQVEKLKILNITHLVDYLVTSEECGYEKPTSIMFETALKKLQCPASQAIMIGDNFDKDIIGAQNLGLRAYHVKVESSV